jgi:hypothetical protein
MKAGLAMATTDGSTRRADASAERPTEPYEAPTVVTLGTLAELTAGSTGSRTDHHGFHNSGD